MSLSKELCLRSDSQNSHSFSDRICDDLCEEILQYLSLEDKLKLEGVSKQFQRTVFQRQNVLSIAIICAKDKKRYWENRGFNAFYHIEDQSMDSFKVLLKKCPNITSIVWCNPREYDPDKICQIFQLISENCNNLRKFFALNQMNETIFEEIHRKFGPKVKYFSCVRNLRDLNRFPNIEELNIYRVTEESIISQLKLTKLKELELTLMEGEEHMLQTCIDTFPKLTHFRVIFYSSDENAIYKPLKNISNLKHLIRFSFHNKYGNNSQRFCGLLKQMANCCRNLKSIDCIFNFDRKNTNIRQFLSQLKAFPALKRLNLWLHIVDNEDEDNIDVNQLFSFELFKGFSNIIHLSFSFNWRITLNESILKEIDIHLPKLQYLEIRNIFGTTSEGVTQMAEILSRLSRLEALKLKFKSGVDFKPIEEQITKKCRKIKEILMATKTI